MVRPGLRTLVHSGLHGGSVGSRGVRSIRRGSAKAEAAQFHGDWRRHKDPESDLYYYHNVRSEYTTWDEPDEWRVAKQVDNLLDTEEEGGEDEDEKVGRVMEEEKKPVEEGVEKGGEEEEEEPDAGLLVPRRIASPNRSLLNHLYRKNTRHDENLVKVLKGEKLREVNESLQRSLRRQNTAADMSGMRATREQLPMFKHRQQIVDAIRESPVVVLQGETGCGKTTQLPQYVLDELINEGRGGEASIICTQPRRVSAVSVATRVAEERGETPGDTVGYAIRGASRKSDRTRLMYCTTGVLLRILASSLNSPDLQDITHIVVDEVHERGILTDFLLILLRGLVEKSLAKEGMLPKGWHEATDHRSGSPYYYHDDGKVQWRRPPAAAERRIPKIILMSATLDTGLLSNYFFGAPIIPVPGRLYPVEAFHLEEIVGRTGYDLPYGNSGRGWGMDHLAEGTPPHVARVCTEVAWDEIDYPLLGHVIEYIHTTQPPGAILVFLTGVAEIQRLVDQLYANERCRNCHVLQLHGSLTPQNQYAVFRPAQGGRRKIVVATNVAETSITVPDVVYVVDTGRVKERRWSPNDSLASLKEVPISMANARQRQGRAGRVRQGQVYRLWPTRAGLAEYQTPEMMRSPLEDLVLQSSLLGVESPADFLRQAVQPPGEEGINAATANLETLGAVLSSPDSSIAMTPLGFHLATLPVDPRLGKMMLFACAFGVEAPMLTIAAATGSRPLFTTRAPQDVRERFGVERSDQLATARAYRLYLERISNPDLEQWMEQHGIAERAMNELGSVRNHLEKQLQKVGWLRHKPGENVRGFHAIDGAEWHETDLEILRGIIAAGFFPNLARGERAQWKRKAYERVTVGAWEEVKMHPSSVNAKVAGVPTDHKALFVYAEKLDTSQVFLKDSTMVSPAALLLFGPPTLPSVEEYERDGFVRVTKDFKFEVDDYPRLKRLKDELDRVLLVRCMNPSAKPSAFEIKALGEVREFLQLDVDNARLLPPDPIPAAVGIADNWTLPPWLRHEAADKEGEYVVIHDSVGVYSTVSREDSAPTCNLPKDNVVTIREFQKHDSVLRGRISEPPGWISVYDEEDGHRWAKRREAEGDK
eukprot:Hpha_TRINITY_DN22588_c0_g1::TRINITY_DN22588_c0_g1_i1::g.185180::m.185180/K14442/DHX36, RHAU; ATP-dependent RNA helicase DHX36